MTHAASSSSLDEDKDEDKDISGKENPMEQTPINQTDTTPAPGPTIPELKTVVALNETFLGCDIHGNKHDFGTWAKPDTTESPNYRAPTLILWMSDAHARKEFLSSSAWSRTHPQRSVTHVVVRFHPFETWETDRYDNWTFACNEIRHNFKNIKSLELVFPTEFWTNHVDIWEHKRFSMHRKAIEVFFLEKRLRQVARLWRKLDTIRFFISEEGCRSKVDLTLEASRMLEYFEQIAKNCMSRNYYSYGHDKVHRESHSHYSDDDCPRCSEMERDDVDDPGGWRKLKDHLRFERGHLTWLENLSYSDSSD